MVESLSSKTTQRAELIEHVGYTMRVFAARAVLFQDAVAKRAGLNSTDLQLLQPAATSPATPGELRSDPGLPPEAPSRLPSTGWSRLESPSGLGIRMIAAG